MLFKSNPKTPYLYVTFYTTDNCVATEKICQDNDIPGKLVPAPRILSAGCGLAWRSEPEYQPDITSLLTVNRIEWEEMTIL